MAAMTEEMLGNSRARSDMRLNTWSLTGRVPLTSRLYLSRQIIWRTMSNNISSLVG